MKTIEKLNALSEEMLQNIRGGVAGFNDNITLYSSDNNKKKSVAVDNDDTALLTHVLLRQDNPNYERLFQLFGIKTIPHNFLLDENRTIIAIDLQGEELQKTLKQLLSEE